MIEVHRHRFAMSARKVPFEKCTRWRKVCGRSAKDQIGGSIYSSFFTISSERFAKGARKMRERRIHSSHVLPKDISQWHFGCFHSFVQTTADLLYSLYSSLFGSIYLIPDTNSWFWKCNPYGTAKGGERFAKDLRKGGSWELLFSTTPIYLLGGGFLPWSVVYGRAMIVLIKWIKMTYPPGN